MVPRLNPFGSFQQKFLLLGMFVFAGLLAGQVFQGLPAGQSDAIEQVGSHDSIRASLWALSSADQLRTGDRHPSRADLIGVAIVGRFIGAASPVWSDRLVAGKSVAASTHDSLVRKKVRLQI